MGGISKIERRSLCAAFADIADVLGDDVAQRRLS